MGNAAGVARKSSISEKSGSKKEIRDEDIIDWITSHPQRAKKLFHEYLVVVQDLRNDTELNIEDLDESPPTKEAGKTKGESNPPSRKNSLNMQTQPAPSTSPRLPQGRTSPTPQSNLSDEEVEESWPSSLNASISKKRAKHDQDTNAVLLDIAKDIYEELDTDVLFIKILQNVGRLVSADRCSLFLVDEERDELCSKVFRKVEAEDAAVNGSYYRNMKKENEVRVPIGKGIVGYVAKSGKTLNIQDAYSDSRFNPDVDKDTGYHTKTILCCPIRAFTKKIIGVAELINKTNGEPFDERDEKLFSDFLLFCGIALNNAILFEQSTLARAKDDILLRCTKEIFEHVDIKKLSQSIMMHALQLVHAERCSLFLVDKETQELYSAVFYEDDDDDGNMGCKRKLLTLTEGSTTKKIRFPMTKGIAGHVATTGEPLNIMDPNSDPRFNRKIDEETGFVTRNILCMPILNKDRVIGIAQLINKKGGHFTKEDQAMFEAFTVYCGIGLYNVQLYQNALKAERKAKVALEVLSYHATCRDDEMSKYLSATIPPVQSFPNMNSYSFDTNLPDEKIAHIILRMFHELGFVLRYSIPKEVLIRFLLTVSRNYRKVPYHNWAHAFSVTHAMYSIIMNTDIRSYVPELEILATFVACICHDVDHRGTNNQYQVTAQTSLADLYGTSATMEQHHFSRTVHILNTEGHNIFMNISSDQYKNVLKVIEACILATDLSSYPPTRDSLKKLVEGKAFDAGNKEHRKLLRNLLMTACDISQTAKPWDISRLSALDVFNEFFLQGDEEKKLGRSLIPFTDRERKDELPEWEIGFIDFICIPAYEPLCKLLKGLDPVLEQLHENKKKWAEFKNNGTTLWEYTY